MIYKSIKYSLKYNYYYNFYNTNFKNLFKQKKKKNHYKLRYPIFYKEAYYFFISGLTSKYINSFKSANKVIKINCNISKCKFKLMVPVQLPFLNID